MATTWSERSAISTTWEGNFLLDEVEDYILLETGGKIIIEKSLVGVTPWTERVSP